MDIELLKKRISAIETACEVAESAYPAYVEGVGIEVSITLPTRRVRELVDLAMKYLEMREAPDAG